VTYRLDVQRGLYDLVRVAGVVQRSNEWVPAPGARAASTAAADARWSDPAWGQRPVRDAYLAALLPLASAQDHVEHLAHAIGAGPLAFAYGTVARGAMEAAGRAWWLLDSEIDDTRRLGRYMTDRLYSWQETVRLADGITGADQQVRELQAQRMEGVAECAERHGFLVRRHQRVPVAIGEPRPTSMKLLDAILADPADGLSSGATIYRMLSAVAHATLYGLLQPTQVLQRNADGSAMAGVAVDDLQLAQMTLGPVLAYSRAMTSLSALWGWDDALQEWGEHVRQVAELLAVRVTHNSGPPSG
jgi:hypothetical protein